MNTFYQSAERVLNEKHPLKDLLIAIMVKCSSETNDLNFAERAWIKFLQENPSIEDLCQAAFAKEPYLQQEVWLEIKRRLHLLETTLQFGYLIYIIKYIKPLEEKAWQMILSFVKNETPPDKILDMIFVGNQCEEKPWIQDKCWNVIRENWEDLLNFSEETADYIIIYGWQNSKFFKKRLMEENDCFLKRMFTFYLN